jgi:hypothetical protein
VFQTLQRWKSRLSPTFKSLSVACWLIKSWCVQSESVDQVTVHRYDVGTLEK